MASNFLHSQTFRFVFSNSIYWLTEYLNKTNSHLSYVHKNALGSMYCQGWETKDISDKFSFKSWVKTASKAETGASIELWPQLGRCGLLTHWSLHCSAHKCRSEIVKSRVRRLMAKYYILSDKTNQMSSCHVTELLLLPGLVSLHIHQIFLSAELKLHFHKLVREKHPTQIHPYPRITWPLTHWLGWCQHIHVTFMPLSYHFIPPGLVWNQNNWTVFFDLGSEERVAF